MAVKHKRPEKQEDQILKVIFSRYWAHYLGDMWNWIEYQAYQLYLCTLNTLSLCLRWNREEKKKIRYQRSWNLFIWRWRQWFKLLVWEKDWFYKNIQFIKWEYFNWCLSRKQILPTECPFRFSNETWKKEWYSDHVVRFELGTQVTKIWLQSCFLLFCGFTCLNREANGWFNNHVLGLWPYYRRMGACLLYSWPSFNSWHPIWSHNKPEVTSECRSWSQSV